MGEGRDWTRTQYEACPDCGADATKIADGELGVELVREAAAWGRTLATADPAGLRFRPEPAVWSALEYACHTRDLLAVMTARLIRMRNEVNPTLGWWDHESAADDEGYNRQDPVVVAEAIAANARACSAALEGVRGADWDRAGVRRAGEHFTIRGVARFVLHEVIHHRDDAERVLRRVT